MRYGLIIAIFNGKWEFQQEGKWRQKQKKETKKNKQMITNHAFTSIIYNVIEQLRTDTELCNWSDEERKEINEQSNEGS